MTRFKIIIQDSALYQDMKLVLQNLESLGYDITLVDNGNIVCDSGDENSKIVEESKK